jgi:Calcineurin-like phosphoesterase/RTX calcium-binding nonapeptide repeat (4 copies)/Purple acid Phosphatase, N-terminal domain
MGMRPHRRRGTRAAAIALSIVLGGLALAAAEAQGAPHPDLERYPYLTDLVGSSVTVNWATVLGSGGQVRWGRPGSCTANSVSARRTKVEVNDRDLHQWRATIRGLRGNTRYCYRVYLGSTDLLETDGSPRFRSQVPGGSRGSFSFAVFGDWGLVQGDGTNGHQANVMQRIRDSGVRFAVTTGDVPYSDNQPKTGDPPRTPPSDTQYGDLDYGFSTVFAPEFWAIPGRSVPLFVAPGNHGRNRSFLHTWPQPRAVRSSRGRYRMETYCCLNGTTSWDYPSAWYAFTAGKTRFYILDTTWSNSNPGNLEKPHSLYKNDYDYHWTRTSDEYQWLRRDLAKHRSKRKLAFFHFPPWSDNADESSDTYLRGARSLEGLLTRNGVRIAFNGHAHMYERNRPSRLGLITYVTGGGGARLAPIGTKGCSRFDAYGIGWSNSGSVGSACGGAAPPSEIEQVYHFLKVTVGRARVTVTPTDELGRTFDVRSYPIAPPPSAPRSLRATATSSGRVRLEWKPSHVEGGTVRYQVFRNGRLRATTTSLHYDDPAQPGRRYTYKVRAFVNWKRNLSPWSRKQRIVLGTNGGDTIRGSRSGESIFALGGRDTVRAGGGRDRVHGGEGRDRLFGGGGRDLVSGGPGADRLVTRDGTRDLAIGGPDRDQARSDRLDVLRGVEL